MTNQSSPDIVERLRSQSADATDWNGKVMKDWDNIRRIVETHKGSDLPRLMFESLIESLAELMDAASDEIERLRGGAATAPVAWRITDGEGGYNLFEVEPTPDDIAWAARFGRKYEPLYLGAAQQPVSPVCDSGGAATTPEWHRELIDREPDHGQYAGVAQTSTEEE